MNVFYVAVAAVVGAVVSGLLGWSKSGEKFAPHKFVGTVLRSLLAATVFVVGFVVTEHVVGIPELFGAFLAGAGLDVIGKRLAGAIVVKK